jgi:hypothetical protein
MRAIETDCVTPRDLFAYKNKESYAKAPLLSEDGFCLYDVVSEFKRQQLSDKQWRISKLNRGFRYPTFPNLFVVPASISDGTTPVRACSCVRVPCAIACEC